MLECALSGDGVMVVGIQVKWWANEGALGTRGQEKCHAPSGTRTCLRGDVKVGVGVGCMCYVAP